MVWGCFTAKGVGNLVSIDGNMNAELYQTILREDLLGSMDYYGLNVEDAVFEHDNDPKYTAKFTTVWLADQSFEVLDWPPIHQTLMPLKTCGQFIRESSRVMN